MDKRYALAATGFALIAAVSAFVYFSHYPLPVSQTQEVYVVPALTKVYTNDAYAFSLKMPESFEASDIAGSEEGSDTILLQDNSGNGIQIVVSPFEEDTGAGYTLTQERIQSDVPDLKITDAQSVEVGTNYRGLAFKSDNEAFGGASREVWFVFRGNLYQISTYERLDELLKQIFATWQFSAQ